MFSITARRISNGFIVNVTAPSTPTDPTTRPSETYVADAAAIAALLNALIAEHG
jgi:hypothetical protein